MGKVILWTEEEIQFLIDNHKSMTTEELANALGKTFNGIYSKSKRLRLDRMSNWTIEQDDYLLKNFGNRSIESIMEYLNKNKRQIKYRMEQLEGTSKISDVTNNLSMIDVAEIMGVDKSTVRLWTLKNEIPYSRVSEGRVLIFESSFWKWLKVNLNKVNFKNVHDDMEMIVPEWYKNEIKNNKQNYTKAIKGRQFKWTQYEETTAWDLFFKGYTYNEIAKELDRTYDSIKGKLVIMKRKKLNKII